MEAPVAVGAKRSFRDWSIGCIVNTVVVQSLDDPATRFVLQATGDVPTAFSRSAWSFSGRVYCAGLRDGGVGQSRGVYEIFPGEINITNNSIPLTYVLVPEFFPSFPGDGLNCLNGTSQFPNSTTTTTNPPCFSEPISCQEFASVPLQVDRVFNQFGCQGAIKALNVTTGIYEELCRSNNDPGTCYSGCGINPEDNMIYCETFDGFRTLVRLTCNTTTGLLSHCFVGALNANTAATFNPTDNAYIGNSGRLFQLLNTSQLPAFENRPPPDGPTNLGP
eukprot:s5002_g4.t1